MAAKVASRAVDLFKQLSVPVIGFVENMTYSVCPRCGEKTYLHGKNTTVDDLNGVKRIASMPVLVEEDFEGFIKNEKNGPSRSAFMDLIDQIIIMLKK
jgi:ATP-binding protein involved in chromosome partitioning